MIPVHKLIKVRAVDDEDIRHLSEQLRDGLCPLIAMVYENNCFAMLVNRFCWNHEETHEQQDLYYRSHVALLFCHVQKVQSKNFEQHGPERVLNLLNIHNEEIEGLMWIHLVFSQGYEIRLQVNKLEIYSTDMHEPWPTRSKPKHIHEHIEEYLEENHLKN